MTMVNLVTSAGDLDVAFAPSGTNGFDDLVRASVVVRLREGLDVPVAALADVIRSKEAANREKDRLVLPTLRLLLEKSKGPAGPS